MQLPTERLQSIKNVIHGVQGFVIFVAWALTIAVFIKSGNTDGRTKYFFALVRSSSLSRSSLSPLRYYRMVRLIDIVTIVFLHHTLPHLPSGCAGLQSYQTIRQPLRFRRRRHPLRNPLACSLCSSSGLDERR